MAVVSDITTLANATAAAHGYLYSTYSKTVQGTATVIVRLDKQLNPAFKSVSGWFGGYGDHAVLTTAQARALTSLNAARRHRYAGAPGLPSGATIPADLHGDTPTVDVS